VGPSRGIGLMMILSGLVLFVISAIAYANKHIRNIETEIPDVIIDPVDDKNPPAPGLEQEMPVPADY
jgi:hypothetical protein